MIRGILEADYHTGDYLGLTPPEYEQKIAKSYTRPVWEWRHKLLREIGPVDFHLMDGDLTEGPGLKGTLGLFTTDTDEQAEIAVACAREVRAKWKAITFGTPFHTAGSSNYEKAVATELGCQISMALRVKFNGLRFHMWHPIGRSDTTHGQGTQTFRDAVADEVRSITEKYAPADVFLRAHAHYFLDYSNGWRRVVISPTWKLPVPEDDRGASWSARRYRPMYYDVGLAELRIDRDGYLTVIPHLMPMKIAIRREYLCPIKDERRSH